MTKDFTLQRALHAARRRRWILILCLVLTPAAALGVSALQHKEYTAKTFLLFRDPQFDQKLFGSTFVPNSTVYTAPLLRNRAFSCSCGRCRRTSPEGLGPRPITSCAIFADAVHDTTTAKPDLTAQSTEKPKLRPPREESE